ncbi:MAG: asparagine synthase [Burkholderiales bacterium]|nr:asparagine synthase [Burkholderiales bacterium]
MSGICGWSGVALAAAEQKAVIDAMSAALVRFDASQARIASGKFGALAAAHVGNAASVATTPRAIVAVAGRPRFDDPELAALAQREGAAAALALGYERAGNDVFPKLLGAFEAAIIDEHSGACALAVDRVGVHAVRYCVADAAFVFGSNTACLRSHPAMDARIDEQALYDYVYFHVVPGPRTIFRGVQRLMPGERVAFHDGRCERRRYWQMRFEEGTAGDFETLKTAFRASLRHGVEHALDGGSAGAFLSGGTDSSTVAGFLGEVCGEPARTYSIGFDAPGYDEIEYARITARHFATRHREYYVTADDIVSAVPAIAAIHDEPFGNSSAVPAFYCARLAREDGVTRLLAGDGGDELFGGNERYAKQYVFSLYERLPEWLRSKVVRPALNGSAVVDAIGVLRKARSYVQQASIPMPARLQTYNLVDRLGRERMFQDDFLARVDAGEPLRHLDDIYHGAHAQSLINRMLALDLQITLADNDLPKVVRSCHLAGMDVAFPLLDEEVVEFSARLAPEMKLKGTQLRYFFKESLRGFLPDATIAKKKHGFGLPFGPWLESNERLRALAYDSLGSLRRRGIVRPEFLDELTSRRVSEHASYYGSLVWVFMMLEQWFDKHGDVAAT